MLRSLGAIRAGWSWRAVSVQWGRMSQAHETLEVVCPHCEGRVKATLDQCGQTMACPHCDMPFDVVPTDPAPRVGVTGRSFCFECLRCHSVLEGGSDQIGQRRKCPTCGGIFTVPQMDPRTGFARSPADPGEDGQNPTPMHAYAAAGTKAPRIVRLDDKTLVIACPRCRRQSAIGVNNCSSCGLPFTMEGLDYSRVHDTAGRSAVALAAGILSLPVALCGGVGLIPGVIAILLALSVWRDSHAPKGGLALAGIILGTLGCLISVLRW